MMVLGVTGGIGSGKTSVCRVFESLGARGFYADAEARRIMQDDPAVRRELVAAFGPESYDADGRLDRAYLARTVFGNEERVQTINGIVHPRVFDAFREARARAEADGVPLLVYEAALLLDTGRARDLDAVLVVDAPEADRIRRVTQRDGSAAEQVRARIRHQMPADEMRRRADYVIENTGSPEALRERVEALYHTLLRDGPPARRNA